MHVEKSIYISAIGECVKYCKKKNTLKKEKLLAFDLGNFKPDELPSHPVQKKKLKK
jgi:hypothetical protein